MLITVDAERDTQAAMRKSVPDIHPRLIGLTGSEQALDAAYKAFIRVLIDQLLLHTEDFIGCIQCLTGSEQALDAAYKAFSVEKKLVYEHPDEGPIYAHGSYIYLTGPDGAFMTLMPPVLSSDRIAEIVASYAAATASH